jgi:hypothetical protein
LQHTLLLLLVFITFYMKSYNLNNLGGGSLAMGKFLAGRQREKQQVRGSEREQAHSASEIFKQGEKIN